MNLYTYIIFDIFWPGPVLDIGLTLNAKIKNDIPNLIIETPKIQKIHPEYNNGIRKQSFHLGFFLKFNCIFLR